MRKVVVACAVIFLALLASDGLAQFRDNMELDDYREAVVRSGESSRYFEATVSKFSNGLRVIVTFRRVAQDLWEVRSFTGQTQTEERVRPTWKQVDQFATKLVGDLAKSGAAEASAEVSATLTSMRREQARKY